MSYRRPYNIIVTLTIVLSENLIILIIKNFVFFIIFLLKKSKVYVSKNEVGLNLSKRFQVQRMYKIASIFIPMFMREI